MGCDHNYLGNAGAEGMGNHRVTTVSELIRFLSGLGWDRQVEGNLRIHGFRRGITGTSPWTDITYNGIFGRSSGGEQADNNQPTGPGL